MELSHKNQGNHSVNDYICILREELQTLENIPKNILDKLYFLEYGLKYFDLHHQVIKRFFLLALDSIHIIKNSSLDQEKIDEEFQMIYYYLHITWVIMNQRWISPTYLGGIF